MPNTPSRRTFLSSASLSAATAFTLGQPPAVRAASNDKLKVGLVGCGGRGTQAVTDLFAGTDNVELIAMADVFEDKLEGSLNRLRDPKTAARYAGKPVPRNGKLVIPTAEELVKDFATKIKVAPENHFVGFDAYSKLVNSGVDVVMLCTPPGYRPMHFEAAVNAGKHVFTEKPIATDPVGCRRFMVAAKLAEQKKLSVVSGAQRHAQTNYMQTVEKIKNGAIGDIRACYSKYLSGPVFHVQARDEKWADMEWQHRNWYSFVWICGDQIVEQHFHNIDFINWVMGAHPVRVVASGGISWRKGKELYGNIYDHMASDFEYANGVKYSSHCRQYPRGVYSNVSDMVVGSKGVSDGLDLGTDDKVNPYVVEHQQLHASIRGTGPYLNQGMSIAESTMTCIMARESAYSGQAVTWDQVMASQLDLMPKAFDYKLKMDPPALPEPGTYKFA
ncbi:MAG: Gfo/Idh/MocA family oxidoreductase [Bryobacterales bacterium]|nr:Gfo/Idh/MocA family oxidoreductase [Bryobacterales bacterium]